VKRRTICALAVALSVFGTSALTAQGVFAEGRLDGFVSSRSSVQAGGGIGFHSGNYVRLLLLAAGGTTLDSSRTAIGRGEVLARFLLDPFAESTYGLYGFGGLGATLLENHIEPRIILGLGIEGPRRGGRAVAAELGLGGGVRLGLAIRSARPRRR
jgi:hypothetical protein